MATSPDELTVRSWTQLARTSRIVTESIETDLRAAGLPPLGWYDVLLELQRAEDQTLRPFELEEHLLLAQYNLSRLIDRIAAEGYVRKQPVASDRRGHEIVLLPSGAAMRERMWPVYAAAIERHIGSRLDKDEAATLVQILGLLLPQGGAAD
ncbi:MAG: MarR family winged helix-turn-helix transcriptional regulator [Alphaproteobacteria bacterium]